MPEALGRKALARRRVDPREVEAAWALLQGPDPCAPSTAVTRKDVEAVAAYLHVAAGRAWYPLRDWVLIVRGHPAARAIFVHERAELQGYERLGVRQPLRVRKSGSTYQKAHAWACWEEARYWETWAAAESHEVGAAAFLRGHPVRLLEPDEIDREIDLLRRVWGVALEGCSELELQRAREFYVLKHMTPAGREQWLR